MEKPNNNKRIILLDCNAIIHRAYHALPPLTTRKGDMINAVYGFFTMFFKAVKDLKPDYIAATFDLGGETFRHKEFKDYKAHRVEADQELYQQIPIVQDILKTLGVPIFAMRGVEADDIIGAISKDLSEECIIVTGDMDMLQLVDEKTFVYAMRKGLSDIILYDESKVFERFGFGPEHIADYKGLKGDPSDNIPGVAGVGDKTATDLIKQFGTIEEIYEKIQNSKIPKLQNPKIPKLRNSKIPKSQNPNSKFQSSDLRDNEFKSQNIGIKDSLRKKLLDNKDIAIQSKYLATIKRDVKIDFKLEDAKFEVKNIEEVKNRFRELEMESLVKRVEEIKNSKTPKFQNSKIPKFQNSKEGLEGADEREGVEKEGLQRGLFDGVKEERKVLIKDKIEKYYKDGIFSKEIRDLEVAVIPAIEEMEKNGVKVDVAVLKELSEKITKEIKEIVQKVYDFAGVEFNLSSPQQLSEILFEKLHLSKDDIKKTPGGVLSTSASELEKLADKSPVVPLLLKHRELEKLRNTYIDALPELVDPKDGRIHAKFDQLGTVTGRISSFDPNLQNIPVRSSDGEGIRKAFIAEKGFKFVLFDYSQIDLRVIAHLSGDEKMIEAFRNGKDIHKATAAEVFGVKESEVSDEMRRMAKTVNFGIIYGMSAFGMSERSGVSRDDAKKFIDGYFKNFSGVANYIERSKSEAKKLGYVETLFGRKRYVKELQSRNWQLRSAGERMAINMPVQGTSADIVKMAMRDVFQNSKTPKLQNPKTPKLQNSKTPKSQNSKIPKLQNSKQVKLLLQVHDDLLFEISDELVNSGSIIKEIKDIMENVVELKVPLVVDVERGDNWGEMKSYALITNNQTSITKQ